MIQHIRRLFRSHVFNIIFNIIFNIDWANASATCAALAHNPTQGWPALSPNMFQLMPPLAQLALGSTSPPTTENIVTTMAKQFLYAGLMAGITNFIAIGCIVWCCSNVEGSGLLTADSSTRTRTDERECANKEKKATNAIARAKNKSVQEAREMRDKRKRREKIARQPRLTQE